MDLIIREGLFRLSVLYDRDVHEGWEPLWMENLAGIDPRLVEAALRHIEKTFIPTMACPFPTPAHIRNWLQEGEDLAAAHEAEAAWQSCLTTVMRNYHPDLGWRLGPMLEDGRIRRALDAAGGLNFLWKAPSSELVWIKKAFLEFYRRDKQLDEGPLLPALQKLLTSAAKKLP